MDLDHLIPRAGADAYAVPNDDFGRYLVGTWKRNLEWREFGGRFQHLRTSNTVVCIEEAERGGGEKGSQTPGVMNLQWSFGKAASRADLRFGYAMKFTRSPTAPSVTDLEWTYAGTPCFGRFLAHGHPVATLNFCLPTSTVIVTYRVVDEACMVVCIVENDANQAPSLQYGTMYRIGEAE